MPFSLSRFARKQPSTSQHHSDLDVFVKPIEVELTGAALNKAVFDELVDRQAYIRDHCERGRLDPNDIPRVQRRATVLHEAAVAEMKSRSPRLDQLQKWNSEMGSLAYITQFGFRSDADKQAARKGLPLRVPSLNTIPVDLVALQFMCMGALANLNKLIPGDSKQAQAMRDEAQAALAQLDQDNLDDLDGVSRYRQVLERTHSLSQAAVALLPKRR